MKKPAAAILAATMIGGLILLTAALGQAGGVATPTAPAPSPTTARSPSHTAAQMGITNAPTHDPSTIIKCKDLYWVFYTGRGVPSAYSSDLVTWSPGPPTFTAPPPWVAQAVPNNRSGMDFWAPDCMKVSDKYLLFYAVSSFGSNSSAIAIASNPTLDPSDPTYHWTDGGIVVKSIGGRGGASAPPQTLPAASQTATRPRGDDFNTIDPAVFRDTDGLLWLSFGSFWTGIKLIELNPATGRRIAPDSTMYSVARNLTMPPNNSIEAPYVYHHDKFYYLFVNWGRCCQGARSTYNIRMGRSDKITGPYLDKDGRDMYDGGGTLLLETEGSFVGPGHAGIIADGDKYWFSCHYEAAPTMLRGSPLSVRPLTWSAEGWPVVGYRPG